MPNPHQRTHPSIMTLPPPRSTTAARSLLGVPTLDDQAPDGAALPGGSLTVITGRVGQGRTRAALAAAAATVKALDGTDRKVVIAATADLVNDHYLTRLTRLGVSDTQLRRNVVAANVATLEDVALLMATVIADGTAAAAAAGQDPTEHLPQLLVLDDPMVMREPLEQSFTQAVRALTDLTQELGTGAFHLGVLDAVGDRADRLRSFAGTRGRSGTPTTTGHRIATVITLQEVRVASRDLIPELVHRADLVLAASMPPGPVSPTAVPDLTVIKARR